MLNKSEFLALLIVVIILGFSISLVETWQIFLYTCLAVFLVLIINIIAKKITAFYLDTEIEIKPWELERAGFMHFINIIPLVSSHPTQKLKRPFPIGLILPIISTILSYGYFIWLACLTFEVKAKAYRAARRYGLYTFSEVTEYHTGIIAASGIIANLIFAVIGYLIGYPQFATLSIWLALFSMIPISNLDGNKIFFGSLVLWSFLAAVTLIAVGWKVFFLI